MKAGTVQQWYPWIAATLGMASFAGTFPTTRWLMNYMTPWEIGSGRAAAAGLLSVGILVAVRAPSPPQQLWCRLGIGSAGVALGFPLLSACALLDIEAGSAAVLAAVLPLLTALLATIFAGERPSTRFWWACSCGCAAVIAYALWSSEWGWRPGNTCFFLALLCASAGYVAGGSAAREMPAWQVACWLTVPALPLNLLLVVFGTWQAPLMPPSLGVWFGFAQLVLFSQLLGFLFWNYALAQRGIARVGQFQLLQPFVTLTIAALWLGEVISPVMLVAVAVVVASLVWARGEPTIKPPVKAAS